MSDVDNFVGRKIRMRRVELGISQTELAEAIGVKFQQVQKYETGVNRVSASRLWLIAETLRSPIEYFFTGIDPDGATAQSDGQESYDSRSLHLVRQFQKLPPQQQRAVLAMVTSLVGTESDRPGEALSQGG